ncbi:MAG: tetratricopeptide repeat protein, partial [Chloroflexota bacterium]
QNPKNLNLRNLYLASFVQALEYKNRTSDCHMNGHQPWPTFDNAQIKNEWQDLQGLFTSKPNDDSAHWFLRGNLAVDPTNDNIRSLASVPPTPEDAAALMAALRHAGQSKTAIKIANKFPGNNGVQFELAMCHAQSDPDQSIQILNSMVESKFAQPLLHFVLSTIHAKNGDAKAAAENMDYATSLWPMEQSWQIMAAEMWKKIGNLDRSIEHLDAAYQMDSNDAKVVLQLGKAYVSTRQHAKAIAILEGNVKENPNNSLTWQLLSEAYFLNGEFDAAISAAEKAGESDPFSNKPPLLIGKVFLQQMELEKAEEKAALAIELDAKDQEPRILLAKVYQAGGENARALASLELATKCETAGVETHLALVNLMNELNGIASTIEILTDLTCKYPANAELLKLLADAQEQIGESKQAEINAKKALEIQPEEPELHRFLGRLQEHKGNLDQAAHYFGQAVAHDPADTEGYINLCHVLLKQKEYAKAREILEKGMNKAPGDVRLYLELARLLRDAKDYQGAESMLRKASEIAPRNLDVHRQLGAVLALNLVHQSQEVSSRI